MQTGEREELPRISVDALHDWERIKNSYTTAAYGILESKMVTRSDADKQKLRGQLQRVRCPLRQKLFRLG